MTINDDNIQQYLTIQKHNLNGNNAVKTLDQVTANLYNNGYENLVDKAIDDNNLVYANDVLENTTDYDSDVVHSAEEAQGDYLTEDGTDVDSTDVANVLTSLLS